MALTVWIDLTTGRIDIKETPAPMLQQYLGSRGYAARLLYDHVGPQVRPFSPENHLIFSTGPLTGSPWPTAARYTVTAKSPLTQAYGYANSSGFFGPELRKAGFDALVIRGRSASPVVLVVQDEDLKLIDGRPFWGNTTEDTQHALQTHYPKSRVAAIGPAGENRVRIAAVINDLGRAAGRCGMGAVMGSKNLKAVVAKSERKLTFPAPFKELAGKMMRKVSRHPGSAALRKHGTAVLVDYKNIAGDLPTRNHQAAQFAQSHKVNADSLGTYLEKNSGCFACPIRCSRHTQVKTGRFACRTEGPEYETINALGPLVGNDNLESIIYGNLLCNRLGLDTISTGMVIAFAMECSQNGLLKDPAGQLSLKWGDIDTIVTLIDQIARREGLGDLLAEGVYLASEKLGPEARQYALHVKGMELPMQEPRTVKGMALGHAVSNRGADHLYALPCIDLTGNEAVARRYLPDCLPQVMDPGDETYKPDMVVFTEAYNAVSDALGVCKFSTTENFALYPEELAEGFGQLIDQPIDGKQLLAAGERIINLERMYNYRHGLDRQADQLPERFLKEPLTVKDLDSGRAVKSDVTVDLDFMLDRYYTLRGWEANGIPTANKLKSLGLDDLVRDLEGA